MHLDRLEILEQGRPIEIRRARAARDDVVAFERAHRNRMHRGTREELAEVVLDLLVDFAIESDEVHLVDREHEVGDTEQPGDSCVAL